MLIIIGPIWRIMVFEILQPLNFNVVTRTWMLMELHLNI